jgi:hypothetical protein
MRIKRPGNLQRLRVGGRNMTGIKRGCPRAGNGKVKGEKRRARRFIIDSTSRARRLPLSASSRGHGKAALHP